MRACLISRNTLAVLHCNSLWSMWLRSNGLVTFSVVAFNSGSAILKPIDRELVHHINDHWSICSLQLQPRYRPLRAGLFIGLGLSGIIPAIHYSVNLGFVVAFTAGNQRVNHIALLAMLSSFHGIISTRFQWNLFTLHRDFQLFYTPSPMKVETTLPLQKEARILQLTKDESLASFQWCLLQIAHNYPLSMSCTQLRCWPYITQLPFSI